MDEIERKLFGCKEKENKIAWEVAYDLRFIELEKMKNSVLQKSIQEIYQNAIKIEQDDLKLQALEILASKIYINSRGNLGIIDNFLNSKEERILCNFLYKKDKKKTKYCITYEED